MEIPPYDALQIKKICEDRFVNGLRFGPDILEDFLSHVDAWLKKYSFLRKIFRKQKRPSLWNALAGEDSTSMTRRAAIYMLAIVGMRKFGYSNKEIKVILQEFLELEDAEVRKNWESPGKILPS